MLITASNVVQQNPDGNDTGLDVTHRQRVVDVLPLLRDGSHLVQKDPPQLHNLRTLLLAQPQRPLQCGERVGEWQNSRLSTS
jgi:hypothetical protein